MRQGGSSTANKGIKYWYVGYTIVETATRVYLHEVTELFHFFVT